MMCIKQYLYQLLDSDEEHVKEELFEDENIKTESDIKLVKEEKLEDKIHEDISKINIVDPEEVDRVIEEFKNRFSNNRTCIICGFIAANRRSISSHMAIFHK